MIPRTLLVGPFAAASDNGICLSQTPSGAGNLTINGALASGGVATLDVARRVILTFAASEVGHSFVVYGTNSAGTSISETIAGTGIGIVVSTLSYKTVTRISISAAATGAIKAGTSATGGVADSAPVNLNMHGLGPSKVTVEVTGTINYTVAYSADDLWTVAPTAVVWIADSNATSQTGTKDVSYTVAPRWLRVTVNSFTSTGSIKVTVQQTGLAGS